MKKLLIATVLLVAGACGTGADPAATTASPDPTTTTTESTVTTQTTAAPTTAPTTAPPTSTTRPTPTSAPTTNPPSTTTPPATEEVLSPSGFWEVRIGQTVAENEDRIGAPLDDVGGDPNACLVLQLPEVGGVYFIASTLTGEPVDGRGDLVVGRVSAESPGWMTENGIEVGMSVADAEEALGDTITAREPHFYVEGGEYIIVGPEDGRYVFETDGETITAIHAGMEPIVSYVEACA